MEIDKVNKKRFKNKQRKIKNVILSKCKELNGIHLCDDTIAIILQYVGYHNIQDFRLSVIKNVVFTNYKKECTEEHIEYTNKVNIVTDLIYKFSNSNILQMTNLCKQNKIFEKNGLITKMNQGNIDKILFYMNRITDLHKRLCQKQIKRTDYEYFMKNVVSKFKNNIVSFLKHTYPEKKERMLYKILFDNILNFDILL
jgi:hypothetical protein